ncbi:hypothetical protein PVK06_000747 [Gossypium arboreum]|uniref:Mre11 DNA-binding domain-containing protein n=1 Tax=Gossypium arboreum TaxID=29729 RepID=A0ABR0R0E5_GOSAR|nr:hypothetical protein PVK06_000747 [Gossypium arboreum]
MVDYSGFMTINLQRLGQKYVGKVANPQDILIFQRLLEGVRKKKMEILPVNDLDVALHNFVNKDEKLAFYNCVQYNFEETRNKIGKDSDALKCEEEDLVLKYTIPSIHILILQERVKERSSHSKDTLQFTSSVQSFKNVWSKNDKGIGSAASFSDDEDTAQILSSAYKGRKGPLTASRSSGDASELVKEAEARGRGSSGLKQTTLDATLGFHHSQRSASVFASAAVQSIANDKENVNSVSSKDHGINKVDNNLEKDEIVQGKGREPVLGEEVEGLHLSEEGNLKTL